MEHHNDDFSSEDDNKGFISDSNEEIEFEDQDSFDGDAPCDSTEEGPYCQEPLADEDWLLEYNRERKKIEERQQQLQNRLDKIVQESTW